MRAAVFFECGGPEVLSVTEVPDPVPGPGEARIRVAAAALNHLDVWVRRGLPMEYRFPHIGGSDMAGVVESVGAGVDGGLLGRRVVVDPSLGYDWYDPGRSGAELASHAGFRVIGEHVPGGMAELAVVPAANLVQLPDSVDFDDAAAAALASVTAWHALFARARLTGSESVLVTGASGGVSTMAVQMAADAGSRVYALTSGPENVARVRELGADVVYDRMTDDWGRMLWRDTEKRGVDVVLDSVGEAIWPQCLRALAPSGRLVTYGATTGPQGKTNIPLVFWRQLNIMGSTMGAPEDFRAAMKLVFEGRVRPVVHEVLPLERIERAHELLEAGEVFGKLVIRP